MHVEISTTVRVAASDRNRLGISLCRTDDPSARKAESRRDGSPSRVAKISPSDFQGLPAFSGGLRKDQGAAKG